MSFLALENKHVFITGAAGGIGFQAVTEFLNQGCKVTAHDCRPINRASHSNLYIVKGDTTVEESVKSCMADAKNHFGPINILIANAGITDESHEYPIWEIPIELWQKVYDVNIKGTFITIKCFLQSAKVSQEELGHELENLSIVVTGSETGKFGQAGHTEYASGKAGLQSGLIRGVKNEIIRLNQKARINAVAPGWANTALIGDQLGDPKELWAESQATVALKKIAQPHDIASAMAFLASHRAAGHISGECLSVDGGMEGRIIWKESEVISAEKPNQVEKARWITATLPVSPPSTSSIRKKQVKVGLSVDFDAISGWLGTGANPENILADYSSGIFSGQVGVPRLVKLFRKLDVADKMTWFIPGHSMETFPAETKQVVESGCEVALHGYAHEGAYQISDEQQKDIILHCMKLSTELTGKKPVGWRAPLYQIRESTITLLEELGFAYDTSLANKDSEPFWAPMNPPISLPQFPEKPASSWMYPTSLERHSQTLVEIPCNWYMEDATPLQFYPHTANSHGYVDVRQIEQAWKDRFTWLWENERDILDTADLDFLVFPLCLHPDTSGQSHIIGMIERFVIWLQSWGEDVVFERYEDIAAAFKQQKAAKGKQSLSLED